MEPGHDLPSPADALLSALLAEARTAAAHAYAPYSGFRVGAALRLASGDVVTGANVENASYGLTICAERTALVRAVATFGPALRITAVAVTNLNEAPSPPCGACRQMLAEFTNPDVPVVFAAAEGLKVVSFGVLLPLAFQKKFP
jgi:homotetrameric cytidine deaminase